MFDEFSVDFIGDYALSMLPFMSLFSLVLFSFCSRELMRDLFKILNPEEFSSNIHFFYAYSYYSPSSYSSVGFV